MATIQTPGWSTTPTFNPRVDPRLTDILTKAAEIFARENPGYSVQAFSGRAARASGTRNHPTGRAIDVNIIGPDGKPVGGPRGNVRNGKTFPMYEKYAQTARAVQTSLHPELNKAFRWGGGFLQGVALDQMHFDVSGGGMALYDWDKGLNKAGRNLFAKLGFPDVPSIGAKARETAIASAPLNPDTNVIGEPQPNAGPAGTAYADLVPPTSVKVSGLLGAPQSPMPQTDVASTGFAPGLQPASFTPDRLASNPLANQVAPGTDAISSAALRPVKPDTETPISPTERVPGVDVTPQPSDLGLPGGQFIGSAVTPNFNPTMQTGLDLMHQPQMAGLLTPPTPPTAPQQPAGMLNPTPVAAQPAPPMSPPKTIASPDVASMPEAAGNAPPQTIGPNDYPPAPDQTIAPPDNSLFSPQTKAGMALGGLMGPLGMIGGGLLGKAMAGGLLGDNGPMGPVSAADRFNAGYGISGMNQGMYGPRGATGYSSSGAFATSRGPNQGYDLTNQYGAVTPYDASGHIMANRDTMRAWGGLLDGLFGGGGGLLGDRDKSRPDGSVGHYSGKGLY